MLHQRWLVSLLLLISIVSSVELKREVFVFTPPVDYSVWLRFDWSAITSIVWFGDRVQQEFSHNAWLHGVRLIKLAANIEPWQLADANERRRWVAKEVKAVVKGHFDGINVDFEHELPMTAMAERSGLTSLIEELSSSLKAVRPRAQVSFDVAWSPDCIDLRCYDVVQMMRHVDFFFVMAYDERSQIKTGPCSAGPNSAFDQTAQGLRKYLELGINGSQIVLGVPWYGRDYPCTTFDRQTHQCMIREEPFRGVNCSDSPGIEKGYGELMTLINEHNVTTQWDEVSQNPYFSYLSNGDGRWHQVWYDNVQSLALKYALVAQYGLRGAGMWNSNLLDNSDTAQAINMRQQFWSQLKIL